MIVSATDSALLPPFPQYTAKASAYPSVKAREGMSIGVLEVFKPAFEGLVHILDYGFKTMAVASPGLSAYRIFDFRKTLLARPSSVPREAISEKIKSAFGLGQIGDFRLAGMQIQTSFLNQFADQLQRRLCFSMALAENHKIICISHHPEPCLGHRN